MLKGNEECDDPKLLKDGVCTRECIYSKYSDEFKANNTI